MKGRIGDRPVGTFRTCKEQNGATLSVDVDVFPLEVDEELPRWPEMEERERKWLPLDDAARQVEDDGLGAIIRQFRC